MIAARFLPPLLSLGVVVALFWQLGAAALFEPDEGRNAEKAREILVLNDRITPHENFHPVLDKPIFFYWLIAIAYRLFGVSEWAARLPSILAALGCLALVYHFAVLRWGRWSGLWSVLILLTCVEFFALARIVIFDMTLTFFLTLSLCAFYEASHTESLNWRRICCLALYVALAAATLIKGLIGVVVPALVIFFYLLLTRRWTVVRRIYPIPGALLVLAIVTPWYLLAESRNPGYLYYYLWEEHFERFVTNEFDRGEPWYYFIGVGFVGFLPWSLLLPFAGKVAWQATWTKKFDDKTLYLVLWAVLPFLFFSISKSKLPHYILPIFPALAMLTALALGRRYEEGPVKVQSALSLIWWVHSICALYFLSGWFFPAVLPKQIRSAISDLDYLVWIYPAASAALLAYLKIHKATGRFPATQSRLYFLQCVGLCIFLAFVVEMMVLISPDRSAKPLADAVKPRLTSTTQVVLYDTYLAGMPFYLGSMRPVWLVTNTRKKRTFLGNYYAIGKKADPLTPWGKAILDFDEFKHLWQTNKDPLLIIIKEKNLPRFVGDVGESPSQLAAVDEYLIVSKP
jgi:4-amino-4-deoxy-L-arabinose transferase-like glycosyltransferase